MRLGKAGTWWVLRYADSPIYFTGEMTLTEIEGKAACIPVFVVDPLAAQQFRDRATAVFAASVFGLARSVEAFEMTFADRSGA